MIGLGGGEFRIPILMHRFALDPKAVVATNATISLFTLAASLLFRGQTLSLSALEPIRLDVAALAVGGVMAALVAAGLVKRLSSEVLHRWIVLLLVALGVLLIVEGLVPIGRVIDLPPDVTSHIVIGLALGFGIGIVATLLGVAGGELLIPTFIFIYGIDVKTAGTASLVVSLCVVVTGVVRFFLNGTAPTRETVAGVALPMAGGSVLGAAIGAQLAAVAAASTLKFSLGLLLLAAAWLSSRKRH